MLYKVSMRAFISYTKDHKEDCAEAIEKLKNIVCTNEDDNVREAAYKSLVKIGVDGVEELQKYINNQEDTDTDKTAQEETNTKRPIPNHRINPLIRKRQS